MTYSHPVRHLWGLEILLLFMILPAGGCHIPARIFWSPDGSRAVYINYGQVAVIDAEGRIQFKALGEGTAVWTADGRTAYFALSAAAIPDAPFEPTVFQSRWADADVTPPAEPPEEPPVVVAYSAESVKPLFMLSEMLINLQISPDGNWLAMVTGVPGGDEMTLSLFAWHLPTQSLHLVERNCHSAAAFTGDSRLVYAMPRDSKKPAANQPSRLIEVTLDVTRDQLERQTLLDIETGTVGWVQPLGEGILFSATEQKGQAFNPSEHPIRIARYHRADGSVNVIAEWTSGLFTISPDGRHLLYERITPRDGGLPRIELMMVETSGDNPRVLRDITQRAMIQAMWPNWRGNDQIAYMPAPAGDDPVDPMDEAWRRTDVILYELVEGEIPLRAVKTLSTDWEIELKPRYRPVTE